MVASSLAKGETPGWGEDQERTDWERALPVRNCFFKAFLWVPLFIQIFGSVYHYRKQEGRGSCELLLLWACSPSATLGDQLPPESLHKDSGYKQNSSLENKVSAPHFVLPIPQTVSSSVSRPLGGLGSGECKKREKRKKRKKEKRKINFILRQNITKLPWMALKSLCTSGWP